jgi:hypothetical protein
VLGNVLATPLATMWEGRAAGEARERSRLLRVCGNGPVTCLP